MDDGRQSSDSDVAPHEQVARARLSRITPLSRQALLLTAMDGFTPEDTAYLIGTSESAVSDLVQDALREIEAQTRAKVLKNGRTQVRHPTTKAQIVCLLHVKKKTITITQQ